MASNPFDQFDGGGGNAFDKFDPTPVDDSAGSRADSVVKGLDRGFFNVVGLPMDTANNAANLLKAAVGFPYSEITGKAVPKWLEVTDARDVPGTGAYNIAQLEGTPADLTPRDARDPVQRFAGSAAEAVPQIALNGPQGAKQTAMNVAGAISGGMGQQAAADAGASPAAQALAGTAAGAIPGLSTGGVVALGRGALGRGGSPDLEAMRAISDANEAGIRNPTYGQVSGKYIPQALEALFSKLPSSAGVMHRTFQSQAQQAADNISGIVDGLSQRSSNRSAGMAIQNGINEDFLPTVRAKARDLYTAVANLLPKGAKVDVSGYMDTLDNIVAPVKGASNQSDVIQKSTNGGYIVALRQALINDLREASLPEGSKPAVRPPQDYFTDGTQKMSVEEAAKAGFNSPPPGWKRVQTPQQEGYLVPSDNGPKFVPTDEVPIAKELPYGALEKIRSDIGDKMNNDGLIFAKKDANLAKIYSSLTDAMQGAAKAAGPQAEYALNRANTYWRAVRTRTDALQGVVDSAGGPEGVLTAALSGTKQGASTLHSVMQSLPESARNTVIANVMDRMGKATPGKQNAAGDAWSYSTFLTNYNKMSPQARAELFGRLPDNYLDSLNSLAKFSSNVRDAATVYANPSGTAHSGALIGNASAGAASGALALTGHPGAFATWLTANIGSNLGARLMTNPRFVQFMANSYRMPVSAGPALINQLATQAKQDNDAQLGETANILNRMWARSSSPSQ